MPIPNPDPPTFRQQDRAVAPLVRTPEEGYRT